MLLVDSAKTKVYIGTRVGAENHNIFCSGQFGVLLSCAIAFELAKWCGQLAASFKFWIAH